MCRFAGSVRNAVIRACHAFTAFAIVTVGFTSPAAHADRITHVDEEVVDELFVQQAVGARSQALCARHAGTRDAILVIVVNDSADPQILDTDALRVTRIRRGKKIRRKQLAILGSVDRHSQVALVSERRDLGASFGPQAHDTDRVLVGTEPRRVLGDRGDTQVPGARSNAGTRYAVDLQSRFRHHLEQLALPPAVRYSVPAGEIAHGIIRFKGAKKADELEVVVPFAGDEFVFVFDLTMHDSKARPISTTD